jgi:hypothetical protein
MKKAIDSDESANVSLSPQEIADSDEQFMVVGRSQQFLVFV